MSHYRKIDTRIWIDQKFTRLLDDAKLAFLLILTHPNLTMLGAMKASIGSLSDELRWPAERFREGFAELLANGLVEWDSEAHLLWLPRFFRYNKFDNPNQVKAAIKTLDLLPECTLKLQVQESLKPFIKLLPEGLPEGMDRHWLNQDLHQEQKQELSVLLPAVATLSCATKNGKGLVGVKGVKRPDSNTSPTPNSHNRNEAEACPKDKNSDTVETILKRAIGDDGIKTFWSLHQIFNRNDRSYVLKTEAKAYIAALRRGAKPDQILTAAAATESNAAIDRSGKRIMVSLAKWLVEDTWAGMQSLPEVISD